MNRFKEEFGIDLAELDLDAVQARPRLDTTVQKSRVVVVQQEAAQRRLPAKVAQQLGSVYPKQRKKILHLMSTPGSGDGVKEVDYKTQKSAPDVLDDKPKSDEDVSCVLCVLFMCVPLLVRRGGGWRSGGVGGRGGEGGEQPTQAIIGVYVSCHGSPSGNP